MTSTRLTICAAIFALLSAASATAEPAYVTSTVNLRSAAGTSNEIVGQDSGRQPGRRHQLHRRLVRGRVAGQEGLCDRDRARPERPRSGPARASRASYGDASEYVAGQPAGVYGPPAYYYPYRPYYYRPYYWGYGWGYRRWRRW